MAVAQRPHASRRGPPAGAHPRHAAAALPGGPEPAGRSRLHGGHRRPARRRLDARSSRRCRPAWRSASSTGITRRSRRFQGVLELSSAAFATAIALGLGYALDEFDFTVVIVAAIVQFLPGLRLTQGRVRAGRRRPGRRHGTARRRGHDAHEPGHRRRPGLRRLRRARRAAQDRRRPAAPSSGWWRSPSRSRRPASPSSRTPGAATSAGCSSASTVATLGSRFGAQLLGPTIGVGIAAFVVGLAGNAYSRFLHHPKATVTVPGLTILVPGALGLQGIFALLGAGVTTSATRSGHGRPADRAHRDGAGGGPDDLSESFIRPRTLRPELVEAAATTAAQRPAWSRLPRPARATSGQLEDDSSRGPGDAPRRARPAPPARNPA